MYRYLELSDIIDISENEVAVSSKGRNVNNVVKCGLDEAFDVDEHLDKFRVDGREGDVIGEFVSLLNLLKGHVAGFGYILVPLTEINHKMFFIYTNSI